MCLKILGCPQHCNFTGWNGDYRYLKQTQITIESVEGNTHFGWNPRKPCFFPAILLRKTCRFCLKAIWGRFFWGTKTGKYGNTPKVTKNLEGNQTIRFGFDDPYRVTFRYPTNKSMIRGMIPWFVSSTTIWPETSASYQGLPGSIPRFGITTTALGHPLFPYLIGHSSKTACAANRTTGRNG